MSTNNRLSMEDQLNEEEANYFAVFGTIHGPLLTALETRSAQVADRIRSCQRIALDCADGPPEDVYEVINSSLIEFLNGGTGRFSSQFEKQESPYQEDVMEALKDLKQFFEKEARIAKNKLALRKDFKSTRGALPSYPIPDRIWKADEQEGRVRRELRREIKELEEDIGLEKATTFVKNLCRRRFGAYQWGGDRSESARLEDAERLYRAYEVTVFILEKWLDGEGDTDNLVEHAAKTIEERRQAEKDGILNTRDGSPDEEGIPQTAMAPTTS